MRAWTIVILVMVVWIIFRIFFGSLMGGFMGGRPSSVMTNSNNRNNSNSSYGNSNYNSNANNANNAALNAQRLKDNTSMYAQKPTQSKLTGTPYIINKLVVLSRDSAKDTYSDSYSGTLAAKSPEEVGTVALVDCKRLFVGNYGNGYKSVPGYVWRCDMTLIDRTINAIIYRKNFNGEGLGKEVYVSTYATEAEGDKPTSDITSFLEKLPRR
ncbi:MAG TPA: hypothetical protein VGC66_21210 [Pyrinomonadaceae bacterium]|jgi:hypothetical protein